MISVLIPTRGRPQRLKDAVQSALDTAKNASQVEVLVRVSNRDPFVDDYCKIKLPANVHWWYPVTCDRYPAGIEFLRGNAKGSIFFCGSDDSLFRTQGWDEVVNDAFALVTDNLLVAYADNGQGREKCEQFFTTRAWVDAVGWLMRKEYEHFCCDQDVEWMATAIGRLRKIDVMVEHMHKKYGKAPDDDTYRLVRGTTGVNARDLDRFDAFAQDRLAAVERLRKVLR